MPDQTIVCPNCSYEIKLTEAISAPIVERLRRQFEDAYYRHDIADKAIHAANPA